MSGFKRITSLIITLVLLLSLTVFFPSAANTESDNTLSSEAYVIMDSTSGQVIYQKNMNDIHMPASLTKIMTVILALESLDLDATTTVSATAVSSDLVPRDTIHISLEEGEVIEVKSLMYAAILSSANDAANVLAEAVGGTIEAFVTKMNDKAKEIGCKNTTFVNANGLTIENGTNNETTAYDMALITKYALRNAYFVQIMGQTSYEAPATNKNSERTFTASHKMLKKTEFYSEYVTGGKTGYTRSALYNAVTTATKDDINIICVVLKAPTGDDRYTDTSKLLTYAFTNFAYTTITQQDIPASTVNILSEDGQSIIGKATLTLPGDLKILLHNDIPKSSLIIKNTVPESFTKEATNQSVSITVDSDLMYGSVIESYLQASTEMLPTPEPIENDENEAGATESTGGASVIKTIFKVIGIILLVVIAGIIIIAIYGVVQNNKRRKKRMEERRRRRENSGDSQAEFMSGRAADRTERRRH